MENSTQTQIMILFLSAMLVAVALMVKTGTAKMENWECIKWQQQAENFEGFYWTDWQTEQCHNYIK